MSGGCQSVAIYIPLKVYDSMGLWDLLVPQADENECIHNKKAALGLIHVCSIMKCSCLLLKILKINQIISQA